MDIDHLFEHVEFPRERDAIEAVRRYGSARAAEAALGLGHDTIGKAFRRVRVRADNAARIEAIAPRGTDGFVPRELTTAYDADGNELGSWVREGPTPSCQPGGEDEGPARDGHSGYVIKGVSTYFDAAGNQRGQWVKTKLDEVRREEMMRAAIEAAKEDIPRLAPMAGPIHTFDHLLTQYTFTDYHLGMRAWAEEGGADWNLEIAEDLLTRSFEYLVAAAPHAKVGLICQLGDFLHFDSLTPVTPTSRHIVDAAGHYQEIVRVAIRCLRRLVDFALTKHERVVVLAAEGNHDIASSVWMRELLKTLYENEPRVEVMDSGKPYYAYQWGRTMLAFHHGHGRKKDGLSHYFAAAFPRIWGDTLYRYGSSGHYHHEVVVKEEPGMKWRQFPTLAPNDSHSAREGYVSQRLAYATTYSNRTGYAGEVGVCPAMLEDMPLAA